MKAIKLLGGWAAYSGGETLAVPSQVTLGKAEMLVASGDAEWVKDLPVKPNPETAKPGEPDAEVPDLRPEPKTEVTNPKKSGKRDRTKGRR